MDSFESISFYVLSFVKNLPGVKDLEYHEFPAAEQSDFQQWQAKNASFVLPADLVAFLEFTNGLRVQWSAQCLQTEVVVGTFSINSLRNITRLPVDSLGSPPREQRHHVADARTLPVPCAAYLIDQHPKVGQVALVYSLSSTTHGRGSGGLSAAASVATAAPVLDGVWFCDTDGHWHWLADSFASYYRLMIVHLGILGWQYIFTPQGLDALTMQWMRLYCPQRLMLDLQNVRPAVHPPPPPSSSSQPPQPPQAR